ncbi:MAG TPA: NAD(P)/FAD-dependent oxidoreductase [Candidatus Parcubacteria bacterium]|nr:NAD(P)/FAD-dependent oxidoreductase [Candidatus Parcubacteria bacterium]
MKVAIVGGGTCGLYLGRKLSEKGNSVTIFEKSKSIGGKACSGLFSERIFNFVPESRDLVKNVIKGAVIHFPKKDVELVFSNKFYVIDRSGFDVLLGELAKQSGATINFNSEVSELPNNFERIIGCDGALSSIRKKLGLKDPNFKLGILGFLKKKSSGNYVETWPCENGFIWKIPRGDSIEYGIMASLSRARNIFKNFLAEQNISLMDVQSRVIPQGFIMPRNRFVALCGDAVGLTKPWSGGGVVWGLTAAEILLKNFPDFLKYRRKMISFFLPKIVFSKLAVKIVYSMGFQFPYLLPKKNKIESDFLL